MRNLLPFACALAVAAGSCCPRTKTAETTPPEEPAAEPKPEPTPTSEPTPMPKPEPAKTPAEQFMADCRASLARAKELRAKMIAGKARTVADTLDPLDDLNLVLGDASRLANLTRETHPDAAVRTAGEECDREISSYSVELSLDGELYAALAAVKTDGLDADGKRFVERSLRDFRRAGVDKDDATRKQLKDYADRLTALGQEHDRNIREDVRSVKLDPKQLEGLPQDYIDAHKPGADGKVTITTDYPDYLPFRAYAKDPVARKALYTEFLNRGYPKNEEVFRNILDVRQKRAKLLGYANHAAYQYEVMMSRTPETVQDFIDKAAAVVRKRAKKDYADLLARKKKDDKKAAKVEEWERVYYSEKVKLEKAAFDSQSVRPYFEFNQTRDGLLAITAKLYDIEYKKVEGAAWHPSVTTYDVMRGGEKLGRIHLDLHPRDGKFKHAAEFSIKQGVRGKQLPEAALVCNFPDPAASKGPALMEHDDVETLFHEFGHLMHEILGGHNRWVYFTGTNTDWDFVEAPSMMFEEWAWDPSTLQLFAKHVDTKEAIPAEVIAKMRKARDFGKGVDTERQLGFSKESLDYHLADPAKVDLDQVERDAVKKHTLFDFVDGTHNWAGFGHLNSYAAAYYTYQWSLVIAKDLLSEFKKKGLLDAETARRYRDKILVPGGSRDAADMVKDFLGRPYGFDAYRKWMEEN